MEPKQITELERLKKIKTQHQAIIDEAINGCCEILVKHGAKKRGRAVVKRLIYHAKKFFKKTSNDINYINCTESQKKELMDISAHIFLFSITLLSIKLDQIRPSLRQEFLAVAESTGKFDDIADSVNRLKIYVFNEY